MFDALYFDEDEGWTVDSCGRKLDAEQRQLARMARKDRAAPLPPSWLMRSSEFGRGSTGILAYGEVPLNPRQNRTPQYRAIDASARIRWHERATRIICIAALLGSCLVVQAMLLAEILCAESWATLFAGFLLLVWIVVPFMHAACMQALPHRFSDTKICKSSNYWRQLADAFAATLQDEFLENLYFGEVGFVLLLILVSLVALSLTRSLTSIPEFVADAARLDESAPPPSFFGRGEVQTGVNAFLLDVFSAVWRWCTWGFWPLQLMACGVRYMVGGVRYTGDVSLAMLSSFFLGDSTILVVYLGPALTLILYSVPTTAFIILVFLGVSLLLHALALLTLGVSVAGIYLHCVHHPTRILSWPVTYFGTEWGR